MTTTDSKGPPIDAAAPSAHLLSRIGEWFWRARALRSANMAGDLSHEQLICGSLAQASCWLADGALADSMHASPHQRADRTTLCIAYGLYRESIVWALRAHSGVGRTDDLATALPKVPRAALLEAADDGDSLARVEELLLTISSADLAFRDDAWQRSAVEGAARLAHNLSDKVTGRRPAVNRVRLQRLSRLGLATLVAIAVLGSAIRWGMRARNLAADAYWRTSSAYEDTPLSGHGFATVPSLGSAFFSTAEEDHPWIEFDLGSPRLISSITVQNRSDCCQERAIPLIVESSADHKFYTEVARTSDWFMSWSQTFTPVTARYVKLHVDRKSYLHLDRVDIH